MKYLSTFEVAEKLGYLLPEVLVSSATMTAYRAHSGQVSRWIIPEDAEKPTDARIKSGKYIKQKTDRGEEA